MTGNRYFFATALFPCAVVLSTNAWSAPHLPEAGKEAVVETSEGMLLIGSFEVSGATAVQFKTPHGTLSLALADIQRIDGERFDPDTGVVRTHYATVEPDGDVILDYVIPLSRQHRGKSANILVIGKVLHIETLDGVALPYVAEQKRGYTRCRVEMPAVRLPAIRVKIQQRHAAKIEGNTVRYRYQYTPRNAQTFQLQVQLPTDAIYIETSPQAANTMQGTVEWEKALDRQEPSEFELLFRLPE